MAPNFQSKDLDNTDYDEFMEDNNGEVDEQVC